MGNSYPVKYSGVWLHKKSNSYELYVKGDFKALDKTLKEQAQAYDKLTK